jgi:hydroxyethylthiazole kinase
MTAHDLASQCADVLARLRDARPLVHNITNYVAMDISANALLAAGASPAMVHAREEVRDFVAISSALAINIGTLSASWVDAMHLAAAEAAAREIPWVLDPVGAGATTYRTHTSEALAARRPSVIRGNASEILALAVGTNATGGVDASHGSAEAVEPARALAARRGTVVAMTGATDYVTDGTRTVAITNGHPLMAKVTAVGCTATALVAAACAVEKNALVAASAALVFLGICGERAGAGEPGPGTFRVRLIDALASVTPDDVRKHARLTA